MTLPADLGSAGVRQQGGKQAAGGSVWPAILSAAGLPAATQQPRRLGALWAGYGEILELTAGQQRLIAKRVAPPKSGAIEDEDEDGAADVGHARKLRSYRVEAAFYRHYAPLMRADAARGGPAEGCAIAKPYLIQAEGDDGGGDGGNDGDGSSGAPADGAMLLLLLEDLRPAYPRQPRSYGLEDAKRALEWLACFHATWFESVEVPAAAAAAAAADKRRRRPEQQQRPKPPAPDDADPHVPPALWGSGCYWHLSTRQEELQAIGGEWRALAAAAQAVDDALRGFGRGRQRYGTLVHGDAKAANFVFAGGEEGKAGAGAGGAGAGGGRGEGGGARAVGGSTAVAAYDFQYVGGGYGPRDVAYLLTSSVDGRVLAAPGGEEALLGHYRSALLAALAKRRRGADKAGRKGGGGGEQGGEQGEEVSADDPYPRAALWRHYELSLLDLCRFEAGWGWWGAARWAQGRARDILARLPEVLEAERRSVMAED